MKIENGKFLLVALALCLCACTANDLRIIRNIAGAAVGTHDRYQERERERAPHYPDLYDADGNVIPGHPR